MDGWTEELVDLNICLCSVNLRTGGGEMTGEQHGEETGGGQSERGRIWDGLLFVINDVFFSRFIEVLSSLDDHH